MEQISLLKAQNWFIQKMNQKPYNWQMEHMEQFLTLVSWEWFEIYDDYLLTDDGEYCIEHIEQVTGDNDIPYVITNLLYKNLTEVIKTIGQFETSETCEQCNGTEEDTDEYESEDADSYDELIDEAVQVFVKDLFNE